LKLAVFHNGGAGLYAPVLKEGFRHVFVAVRSDGYWITLDGKDGLPWLDVAAPDSYDLAEFYRKQGFTVVEVDHEAQGSWFPFMTADCLGAAKKVLGVQDWTVRTPWQLYKKLTGG